MQKTSHQRRIFLLLGFFILLIGAYFDNIRGPLLPRIGRSFNLAYNDQSTLIAIGNLGGLICTFLLMPLLNRVSLLWATTAATCFGCAICLLTYVVSNNFLILLAVCLGLGICISLFGTLSNLLVQQAAPAHLRARLLSLLNVMYGVGSFAAPLALTLYMDRLHFEWTWLFLSMIPILVIGVGGANFWAKKSISNLSPESREPIKINFTQSLIVLAMCLYVCGEVLTSMWMVSYLENSHQFLQADAATTLAKFFLVLVLCRLFCTLPFPTRWVFPILMLSMSAAIIVLSLCFFLHAPQHVWWAGLLGPVFPLYVAHVSHRYPTRWRSMTIWMLSMVQASLACSHLVLGEIAQKLGMATAYQIPIYFLAASMCLMIYAEKSTRTALPT